VLFDAARLLHERGVVNVAFDIHGDYTNHEQPFQQDFLDRLDRATPNISYHGPYDNRRVHALMRRMDAVLVPSLWWENSPIVIQEALRAGRPVLCSDIGGMAEKVRDGLDGFHFAAGDAESLAALLTHLARHPDRLRALRTTLRVPAGADAIVAEHLALYRT
jgi:glycosyltransferase involved in cell wall biosynthesis